MTEGFPLYYINLASRPDRREFFEAQCARLGLVPRRIEAVTPADLSPSDRSRYCNRERFTFMRESELACLRSHVKAWQAMIDDGVPFAAIFEDDALISDTLPDFLAEMEPSSFLGLDLVRLDHARRVRLFPPFRTTASGIALHAFRSTLRGAAAYVLSDRGARTLLAAELGDVQIDLALYDRSARPGRLLKRALVNPALSVQFASQGAARNNAGLGRSDIDPPRAERTEDFSHLYRERHPFRYGLRKALAALAAGLPNAADHLVSLPRGLKRARVAFKGDNPFYQGQMTSGHEG